MCRRSVFLSTELQVWYPERMKFENENGKPVEINFQNFEEVLPGNRPGLTRVKFKNGSEEWIKASKDEVVEASAEE